MRTVLIATGYRSEIAPLLRHRPTGLLQIVDKPIIEHVIEALVLQGINQIDIIVSYLSHKIEERLGNGRRWGVKINYYPIIEPLTPFQTIQTLAKRWQDDAFLLAQGDLLPSFHYAILLKAFEDSKLPVFLFSSAHEWTGWGIFLVKTLVDLPDTSDIEKLPDCFSINQCRVVWSHSFLSVRSYIDLQKGNEKMISKKVTDALFPTYAHTLEPGIWISHRAKVHPSVKLKAPVFIGEHCQVKPQAQIGPNAVIESNCVIDNNSTISHSLICSQSYIGEGLEIHNCIIDKNLLINLPLETHTIIKDDVLIGELPSTTFLSQLWSDFKNFFAK